MRAVLVFAALVAGFGLFGPSRLSAQTAETVEATESFADRLVAAAKERTTASGCL